MTGGDQNRLMERFSEASAARAMHTNFRNIETREPLEMIGEPLPEALRDTIAQLVASGPLLG